MLKKSILFENHFWEVFSLIGRIDETEGNLEEILQEIPVSEKDLERIFEFIKNFDFDITLKEKQGKKFLSIPNHKEKIQFIFSFSDWLSIQYPLIEAEKTSKDYFRHYVHSKLQEIKTKYPGYELFNFPSGKNYGLNFPELRNRLGEDFLERLENGLFNKEIFELTFKDGKTLKVLPKRVLYLENNLSLVAEEISERCLTYFGLVELKSLKSAENKRYKSNFTNLEVSDFIYQIRKINGNEVRVILKIKNGADVELNPPFHLMANPCLITNYEGEKIWAASVELSNEFFRWFYDHRDDFELIEPEFIKEKFKNFCEEFEALFKKSA